MRDPGQPIRISLFAPNGRMGKAIAAAVADDPGFAIDQEHGDVLVDFSAPDCAPGEPRPRGLGRRSRSWSGRPASTTRTPGDRRQRRRPSRCCAPPTPRSASTCCAELVEQAAARLGPEWDIEIARNASPATRSTRRRGPRCCSARRRRRDAADPARARALRPRRRARRARAGHDRLRRAARRLGRGRACRDLRRRRRAARACRTAPRAA